jgi:hypothetical protein
MPKQRSNDKEDVGGSSLAEGPQNVSLAIVYKSILGLIGEKCRRVPSFIMTRYYGTRSWELRSVDTCV